MSGTRFVSGERLRAAKLNRIVADAVNELTVTEAPLDTNYYVRNDQGWVPAVASVVAVATLTHNPALGVLAPYYRCTNAGGCAVTLPLNATVAFPVGTMLTYEQAATAAVTFAGAGGVTLRRPSLYLAETAEQYAVAQVVKVATNEWVIYGNLRAA